MLQYGYRGTESLKNVEASVWFCFLQNLPIIPNFRLLAVHMCSCKTELLE